MRGLGRRRERLRGRRIGELLGARSPPQGLDRLRPRRGDQHSGRAAAAPRLHPLYRRLQRIRSPTWPRLSFRRPYAEADGTTTNTERRIQLNRRKVEPRFEARPTWRILAELAGRLGQDWAYGSAEDVFADIRRLVPAYAGATYARLAERTGGLQWPVDASHPEGTPSYVAGRGRPRAVSFRACVLASACLGLNFRCGSWPASPITTGTRTTS